MFERNNPDDNYFGDGGGAHIYAYLSIIRTTDNSK